MRGMDNGEEKAVFCSGYISRVFKWLFYSDAKSGITPCYGRYSYL